MKKDTAVKKITTLHNTILESVQKLRDFIHQLDDVEICEQADNWCECVEEFLENDGSADVFIDMLDDVFIEDDGGDK